jgi:hypothetical protein
VTHPGNARSAVPKGHEPDDPERGRPNVISGSGSEGLGALRFVLVLSGFAPLFVLWAIEGCQAVGDASWRTGCLLAAALPYAVLLARMIIARCQKDSIRISVVRSENLNQNILLYLVACLLPLYAAPIASFRQLIAVLLTLLFITYLFWRLDLHYINIIFLIAGYNFFLVVLDSAGRTAVLLSKRKTLQAAESVDGLRLSDSVVLEGERGSNGQA